MQTLLHTYLMVPSSDDGGEVVCSNQFEIYHHTSDYAKPQKCGLEMYVVARRLRERESHFYDGLDMSGIKICCLVKSSKD
jgi:hypothetical protein